MGLPATPAGPTPLITLIVCDRELAASPGNVLFAVTFSVKGPVLLPSLSVSLLSASTSVSVKLDPLNTLPSAELVMVAPIGSPAIVTVSLSSLSTGVTVIEGSVLVPFITVAVVPPTVSVGGSGASF